MAKSNLTEWKPDEKTLEYVHNEITKLEIDNHQSGKFSEVKDRAYRDVIRIVTNQLNKDDYSSNL